MSRSLLRVSFLMFALCLIPMSDVDAARDKNYLGDGMVGIIRNDANAIFFPPKGWKKDKTTKNLFIEFNSNSKKGLPTFITVDEVLGTYIQSEYVVIKTWSDFMNTYLPYFEKDTEYKHVIDKAYVIDGVSGVRVDTIDEAGTRINVFFEKYGKVYAVHVQLDADEWKSSKIKASIDQSIQSLSVRRLNITAH